MARPPAPLLVADVVAILADAEVDCSALTIAEDPAVWADLETGEATTSVVISGPAEVRQRAYNVLLGRGLAVAPYPEYDAWSR